MFSPHPMDQQVSPCYHSFLTVAQTYDSKVTPIGALHAEKIAEAVLLYVFRITFPASPFPTLPSLGHFLLAAFILQLMFGHGPAIVATHTPL